MTIEGWLSMIQETLAQLKEKKNLFDRGSQARYNPT
jgi:hypothetical protein